VGSGFFLVLIAMFALMYFMLIRPQRAQQRQRVEMLNQLKVGDEVITGGGIYGEVVQLDAERVMVEIDDDVRIAVARQTIAAVVPPEELERLESDAEEPKEAEEPEEPAELEAGITAEEPMTAEERSAR
jgi:preprotein translocase subunit YajC